MEPDHHLRVLLADDDPRVCRSLNMLLRHSPGLTVVGEGKSDILDKATNLRPDIILLDWELSGESPDQLFSALHSLDTEPTVIVLSVQPERELQALAAGADAFVSKVDPPEKLLHAVDRLCIATVARAARRYAPRDGRCQPRQPVWAAGTGFGRFPARRRHFGPPPDGVQLAPDK